MFMSMPNLIISINNLIGIHLKIPIKKTMKDLWTCDYCSCIDIDINALPSPAPLKQYGGCFDTSLKGIAATSVPSVCIYLCNIR